MFVFVSQVRKKRAMDARVSVNLKTCYSGCMSTVARASKRLSQKKIPLNKTEMSIIIGMAGECQQITDQNQWTTVRTGDIEKAQFISSSLELLKHTGTPGTVVPPDVCLAPPLSASSSRSYTADVVFQGQDMHAFFIHHHEQARNVRKSFRRYRSSNS